MTGIDHEMSLGFSIMSKVAKLQLYIDVFRTLEMLSNMSKVATIVS